MPKVGDLSSKVLRRSSRLNPSLRVVPGDVEEDITVVGNSSNTNTTSLVVQEVVPSDVDEDVSVDNNNNKSTNPCPPLKFRRPSWYYRPRPTEPEGIRLHHPWICEQVEMTLLRSRSPPLPQQELEKKIEERVMERNKWHSIILTTPLKPGTKKAEAKWKKAVEKAEEKKREELNREREEDNNRVMMMLQQQPKTPKYSSELYKKWSKLREVPTWRIEEGEEFDVIDLLTSERRDYLINHNGDQFNIKDWLSGKFVLLYFLCLPESGIAEDDTNDNLNLDLKEIYDTHKGHFEVVFVGLGDNEVAFIDSFSKLPGLAIPHDDQLGRDYFVSEFYIPLEEEANPILFDPEGKVLLKDATDAFLDYGSRGFPFTRQKLEEVWSEFYHLWHNKILMQKDLPSLTDLFGKYVTTPTGDKVLTASAFEEKIVGLHFFEISPFGFRQTKELLSFWESLKRKHEEFEIVFVKKGNGHLSIAKEAFKQEFGYDIPWYSPFSDDGTARNLCGVIDAWWCDSWRTCRLLILKPDRYECLSFFAYGIYEELGQHAYPFTLESAVEFEKSTQKNKLVLGKLLSPSAPLRRGGCYKDTTVSKLLGKRVLLFFATHACYQCGSLPRLKKMYENRGLTGDDDFEIIYISLDCCDRSESAFNDSFKEMPWLMHSFVPDFGVRLARRVFGFFPELPAIAAFGADGHLETKESKLAFKKDWKSSYPFIEAELGVEVHKELIYAYNWALKKRTQGNLYSGPCP